MIPLSRELEILRTLAEGGTVLGTTLYQAGGGSASLTLPELRALSGHLSPGPLGRWSISSAGRRRLAELQTAMEAAERPTDRITRPRREEEDA